MKGLTVLASRERELSPFSGFEASHLSASPATVMAEPATGTRSPDLGLFNCQAGVGVSPQAVSLGGVVEHTW